MRTLTAFSPLVSIDNDSGISIWLDGATGFPAKILSGTQPYAWEEVTPQTGGGNATKPSGRSGTTTVFPAYELNGQTGVSAGTIVQMYEWFADVGATGLQNYGFTVQAGSSGTITVENEDDSQEVDNVSTLIFSKERRFNITSPIAGTAKVELDIFWAQILGKTTLSTLQASGTALAGATTVNLVSSLPDTFPTGTTFIFSGAGMPAPVSAVLTAPGVGGTFSITVTALANQINNNAIGNNGTAYAWQEMTEVEIGQFAVLAGGRSGTTSVDPAYEANGNPSVPTYTIVEMWRGFNSAFDGQEYLFEFSAGSGSGTITVENEDATQIVNNVNTLIFSKKRRFTISSPGAGVANAELDIFWAQILGTSTLQTLIPTSLVSLGATSIPLTSTLTAGIPSGTVLTFINPSNPNVVATATTNGATIAGASSITIFSLTGNAIQVTFQGFNPPKQAYAWREMTEVNLGQFAVLGGGRSGTILVDPAYEANGNPNVPSGAIVEMWRGFLSALDGQEYLFEFSPGGTGGPPPFGPGRPFFFAQLTDYDDTSHAYAWEEMIPQDVSTFIPLPNGRSGSTTVNPAYCFNSISGTGDDPKTPIFTIVLMYQGFYPASDGQEFLFIGPPVSFFAKITGFDLGSHSYSWIEQDLAGGVSFVDRPNGKQGDAVTVQNQAYEITSNDAVPNDTIVRMWFGFYDSGPDNQEYVFYAPIEGITVSNFTGTQKVNNVTSLVFDADVNWSITAGGSAGIAVVSRQFIVENPPTIAGAPPGTPIYDIIFAAADFSMITGVGANVGKVTINTEGLTIHQSVITDIVCVGGTLTKTKKCFQFRDGLLQAIVDPVADACP